MIRCHKVEGTENRFKVTSKRKDIGFIERGECRGWPFTKHWSLYDLDMNTVMPRYSFSKLTGGCDCYKGMSSWPHLSTETDSYCRNRAAEMLASLLASRGS